MGDGPISAEELRRRTAAPQHKNPTDPSLWGGKLNIYTCEQCKAHVVTRDVDEGVTPFMLPSRTYCPNRCGPDPKDWVHMTSSMYRVWDQRMREDFQWYRPKAGEAYDPAYREHVEKGGLILRPNPEGRRPTAVDPSSAAP